MSRLTSKPSITALETGFSFGGILRDTLSKELPGIESVPYPSAETGSDRYWMIEALRESMKGVGISNPNPSVGCIIVDSQGREISRGATQAFRGLHAERVAFNQIPNLNSLDGATAYVTLEPCSHHGNQPPCVDLLLSSKIHRVVVACTDPNPKVGGEGIRKLKSAGKQIQIGLLNSEATAWNFPFFANQKLKRPVFILKWAQTLDGQLADDSNTSKWISGPLARSYTHWLRQRYDAILVGARTVLSDHPNLNVRDCSPPHQAQPLPIVFDPRGLCMELDQQTQDKLKEQTFRKDRHLFYVTTATTIKSRSPSWIEKLENVTVLSLSSETLIPELVSILGSTQIESQLGHPLQSVFVEGGPSTLGSFIKANYADLLQVFVAPIITGGRQNRVSPMKHLQESCKFQMISTSRIGSDLLMELVSSELQFDKLSYIKD